MGSPRNSIFLLASLLILLGAGLTFYKVYSLGFPLLPGEIRKVWTIESKVRFKPSGGPVEVELKLPQADAGWVVLDEHFASSGLDFAVVERDGGRWARWTRDSLPQEATLYYKLQAYRQEGRPLRQTPPLEASKPLFEVSQLTAAEKLIARLRERSVNPADFARLLAETIGESQDHDANFLLSTWDEGVPRLMLAVLSQAGIPARELRGIWLEDGRRRQTLSSLIEVHDGDRWHVIDPRSARQGLPPGFFIWKRSGEQSVLNVVGGRDSALEFALVANRLSARALVNMEQKSGRYALLDFSIYSLPVEQQGVFKGLLLIPVAALVVVLMRVLVGVSTSGTFMPILIAIAFMQTTLIAGLAIFVVLVGAGLLIRSWLSHMNLLLVARISAVVIVVIFLMAALAIVSYKLGIEQALTVTFFPTIILAWTIERMSILWEEEGGHEVLVQGGGSLLVAVIAYVAMANPYVAHLTFNFPELTLSLLGLILLLGNYTGYRLVELYRFRDMGSEP